MWAKLADAVEIGIVRAVVYAGWYMEFNWGQHREHLLCYVSMLKRHPLKRRLVL